ncbi:MAG: hypothetical protein HY720_19115 [Planctomycetes bacterium]|nr:hypothetical protein [Planctomycetota bacterium]
MELHALPISALAALSFALKATGFRMPLENNAAAFLYPARFRGERCDAYGQYGTSILFHLLYWVFGERWGYSYVRAAMALASSAATAFIVLLGARAFGDPLAGYLAGLAFAISTSVPQVISWYANSERFIHPFTSLGYLALLAYAGGGGAWLALLSGLCLGISFFLKLPAILETLPAGAALLLWPCPAGRIVGAGLFALGWVAPYGLHFVWAMISGRGRLYGELVGVIRRYKKADAGLRRPRTNLRLLRTFLPNAYHIVGGTSPVWVLALAGMAAAFAQGADLPVLLFLGWLAAATAGLFGQMVFSPGHWVSLLPPLSLLAGHGAASAAGLARSGRLSAADSRFILAFLGAGLVYLVADAVRKTRSSFGRRDRFQGPLRLQETVGQAVRKATREGDRILVWGWHPQIYIHAGRPNISERLFYCYGTAFLDAGQPGWRAHLLERFVERRPALVVIANLGCPLRLLQDLAGCSFRVVPLGPDAGSVLALAPSFDPAEDPEPGPGGTLERIIGRAMSRVERHLTAGEMGTAERVARHLALVAPERDDVRGLAERVAGAIGAVPPPACGYPERDTEVVLCATPAGMPTALCSRGEGKPFFLHDPEDPVAQMTVMLPPERIPPTGTIVLLGTGFGYLAQHVLDHLEPGSRLFVVERRAHFWEIARKTHDWDGALASGRLVGLVGESAAGIHRALAGAGKALSSGLSTAWYLDGDYYEPIAESLGLPKVEVKDLQRQLEVPPAAEPDSPLPPPSSPPR